MSELSEEGERDLEEERKNYYLIPLDNILKLIFKVLRNFFNKNCL